MSFSAEWDALYRSGKHRSIWPWSDVVRLVHRYKPQRKAPLAVLELGCGAGANIPFLLSLGVEYHAVEGSSAAVSELRERFPQLSDRIVTGDFSEAIPFDGPFDIVLDRSALGHNSAEAVRRGLSLVKRVLAEDGRFIGVDWFSTEHSEFTRGTQADDRFTRCGYTDGQFSGVGRVHFFDRGHIEELLSDFDLLLLEHRATEQILPSGGAVLATWSLVAEPKRGAKTSHNR